MSQPTSPSALTSEPDFDEPEFDEHDPEESPPGPKGAAKPELSTDEISRERDRLFREGSEFKPTHRGDIVGIDDVLDEIDEIIHWLRHSAEYSEHNARLEPGIILAGSPGTGKTSSARYVATMSDARFISVRDFPHNGDLFTDSDMRDLFRRARASYAKDKRPVVLFWDEFEGVAYERSADKTTPAQAAVVSQLTSELEGALGKNEGILLIGCTNYLSSIDEALRRSGRLGVHYEFHAPDREGKQKILAHYIAAMSADSELDTETLSHFFDKQATAADIEEAVMEAWRNSVRRYIEDKHDSPYLAQEDLIKVFIKRLVGPPTTFRVPDEERIRIAIHELGHAIVAMAYGVKVRLITVQPGKKSLGRTMTDDLMEYIATKEEIVDWIRVGAGGIAAERVSAIPEMIGCTGDISMINKEVHRLIDRMGYGETTGFFNPGEYSRYDARQYTKAQPSISEEAILRSDRECKSLIDQVERDANAVMEHLGPAALWEMAEILNQRITLTGKEFEEIFDQIVGFPATDLRRETSVVSG